MTTLTNLAAAAEARDPARFLRLELADARAEAERWRGRFLRLARKFSMWLWVWAIGCTTLGYIVGRVM